ncbi:MAG: CPBP family intramembrane glutamic endopeptidase [Candidatus Neomarinimicrobiota bacterium]
MLKNKIDAIVALIVLASLPTISSAQGTGLTRKEVLKNPLMSASVSVITANSIGFLDSTDLTNAQLPWWMPAIIAPQHLPMYKINPGLAKKYSIAEGVFLGAHYATRDNYMLAKTTINLYMMTAWYSSYNMYKINRNNAAPGVYKDEWKGYSVKELAVAPIQFKKLIRPMFLLPVGLIAWSQFRQISDSETSIFETKKAYIDGKEYSVGAGLALMTTNNIIHYLATGIGEEVLYRGFIYEELRTTFGSRRAKFYDFFIFPSIHIPMDLAAGRKSDEIGGRFVERGIATLLFDYAYDRGGLPLAVSLHTWFNFINFTTNWMRDGGVPDINAIEENGGSASISAPLIMISYTWQF